MKTKEEILENAMIPIIEPHNMVPLAKFRMQPEYKCCIDAMQLFADQEVKAAIEKRDTEILEFINKSMFVGFITTESLKKFINNEI